MKAAGVRVVAAQAQDAPAWDDYVRAHAHGSAYHLDAWGRVIETAFGHPVDRWLARDADGVIRGLLPLARLESRLFGRYAVSMPCGNYGGALADDPRTGEALMAAAGEHARALNLGHIEFRDPEPRASHWPVRSHKAILRRTLPDSAQALWSELPSKLRSQVRRPGREGATAVAGGIELLPDFYRVFARNMRDLGTPVYGIGFFRTVLDHYPDAELVLVQHDGEPVAGGLLLAHGDSLEIPWASSLRSHNRLGVNMLLYWRCLERAIERGCSTFDFGRSSVDSGTYRFKRQWGAEPAPCYWHYWLPDERPLPELSPDNPKYRLAIRLWQRLPLPVANRLGPHIVRNLP